MKLYRKNKIIFSLLILVLMSGCNKLIDVGAPKETLVSAQVFASDANAITAINGLLANFAGGRNPTIGAGAETIFCATSADELDYRGAETDYQDVYNAKVLPVNYRTGILWTSTYSLIYQANACIEGLSNSVAVTPSLKNQLLGESKLIRAFLYFYLIQNYGNVPLELTTSYSLNATMPRTPVVTIFPELIKDLQDARLLMNTAVVSGRANKYAVDALLARIYLVQKDWANAELMANEVIASGSYTLLQDLNAVFLADSKEAIWQINPVYSRYTTVEGALLIPANSTIIPSYTLTTSLLNAFEPNDKRKTNWTNVQTGSSPNFVYPYKYKLRVGSTPNAEFNTLIRVAEVYLIKAEAEAQQNKLNAAIADVDLIRARAGLSLVKNTNPGISQANLLIGIAQERRIELFCEWGNRWFDLKRRNEAETILKPLKSAWDSNDLVYPIPQDQILLNHALVQNPGYN